MSGKYILSLSWMKGMTFFEDDFKKQVPYPNGGQISKGEMLRDDAKLAFTHTDLLKVLTS